MLKPRFHYFSICLSDETNNIRSAVIMSQSRKVTAPLIRGAYKSLHLPDDAVVVSVSWLGRMTPDQYLNGVPENKKGDIVKLLLPWCLCAITLATLLAFKYL